MIFGHLQGDGRFPSYYQALRPSSSRIPAFALYAADELEALAKRMSLPLGKLKDKVQSLREFNPMLGHRGCRLGITFPEMYEMQVRAIIEASGELIKQGLTVFPQIMLPFISHVGEIELLRKLVIDTSEQVKREKGVELLDYKIGVMIELPRAALAAN